MADKENKFVTTIKNIPSNVKKDVQSASTTTKVVAATGVGLLTVGSFLLGRVTKKAPKAATVTPKAAN
jgi:hypothetical protein